MNQSGGASSSSSLKVDATPFEPAPVDLREDPSVPDDDVHELSCFGGKLHSLTQIVALDRFSALTSLCVHGCFLTRMEVDPLLRACGGTLAELNLSSNRIARIEGLPALPALRVLDLTNNRVTRLDGLECGAPALERLVMPHNRLRALHALASPRTDGAPWSLRHLDVRDNHVASFADVAAGLGAVVSLRSMRLASSGGGDGAGRGNAVCALPSYRQGVAALAPWLEELDGSSLARTPAALREGAAAIKQKEQKQRQTLRQEQEQQEQEQQEQQPHPRPGQSTRRPASGLQSLVAAGEAVEAEPTPLASRPAGAPRTPKIDEALQRYHQRTAGNSRGQASNSGGPGHPSTQQRTTPSEPNAAAATSAAVETLDDDVPEGSGRGRVDDDAEVESVDTAAASEEETRVRRRQTAATSARPTDPRDGATGRAGGASGSGGWLEVLDHEARLQMIERNVLPIVSSARRNASATIAAAAADARRHQPSVREAASQASPSRAPSRDGHGVDAHGVACGEEGNSGDSGVALEGTARDPGPSGVPSYADGAVETPPEGGGGGGGGDGEGDASDAMHVMEREITALRVQLETMERELLARRDRGGSAGRWDDEVGAEVGTEVGDQVGGDVSDGEGVGRESRGSKVGRTGSRKDKMASVAAKAAHRAAMGTSDAPGPMPEVVGVKKEVVAKTPQVPPPSTTASGICADLADPAEEERPAQVTPSPVVIPRVTVPDGRPRGDAVFHVECPAEEEEATTADDASAAAAEEEEARLTHPALRAAEERAAVAEMRAAHAEATARGEAAAATRAERSLALLNDEHAAALRRAAALERELDDARCALRANANAVRSSASGDGVDASEEGDAALGLVSMTPQEGDAPPTPPAAWQVGAATRETTRSREAALERALERVRAEAAIEAARHAEATEALKRDHAAFAAAMNAALSEAKAARDAIAAAAAEAAAKSEDAVAASGAAASAAALTAANGERDAALAAAAAAESTLGEVRSEFAATLQQMRDMHAAELASKDATSADAARAKEEAEAAASAAAAAAEATKEEVRRVNERVAAVEDEFRWALHEAARERKTLEAAAASYKREAEEMTRVARAAVSARQEAERLAEELAEVAEEQRAALEEMARERRRTQRAEEDAAAARADLGEMTARFRAAEAKCAAAAVAERDALDALAAVKDKEAAASSALHEVEGVKAQLELAHDNVRIKNAMLESQVELIASLKAEAARAREAQTGAVKAAADSERAADSRARQLDDDLRAVKRELAAQDAAVERLEAAVDDLRARKDAAETAEAAARRDVEERDQMLAYVSAEVENVKGMFAEREGVLRRERDELAAQVAERDEVVAAAKAEAGKARDEAVAASEEVASAKAAAEAREAAARKTEEAAAERVRQTEGEMRALLSEMAQQKKSSRERVQQLGTMLQSLYN